jgi:hypothetical protein
MQQISTKVNLSESVSRSIARVSDKSLVDALTELVLMVPSPDPNDLEKQAKEAADKFPLQHLFEGVVVNEKGKVVARRPSMLSNGPEAEEALRSQMNEFANHHQFIFTNGVIEPARQQILLEHNVQITDLLPVVSDNPFVPSGREYIFAQGLLAGIEGDYCVALHLLIPQIENSIRHILADTGMPTSGLDDKGIQDEWSLNRTLYEDVIESIFGKKCSFDLRHLLVERTGVNLRNRLAHGLMSYDNCFSIQAPYLWCLVLRLCLVPTIKAKHETKIKDDERSC